MSHAVSQTETETANSPADEQIRKIYAKDLKNGETVHTVFRATKKEKAASRAGKPYLALTLTDRTGEVDGHVFENADAADGASRATTCSSRAASVRPTASCHRHRPPRAPRPRAHRREGVATEPHLPRPPEPKEEKKPRDRERTEEVGGGRLRQGRPVSAPAQAARQPDHRARSRRPDLADREELIEERVVARLSGQPLPTTTGPKVEKKPRAPRPDSAKRPEDREPQG